MTLETCCECDAPTGRAGQGEDSLYAGNFGPYCEDCWDDVGDTLANEIERLHNLIKHQARRVRNHSNPDEVFEAVPVSMFGDETPDKEP